MDRVWKYEDFYGRADMDYLSGTTREIWALAAQIHDKMGKRGYLLDSYLGIIFAAMCEMNTLAAMEQAQEKAREFNSLLTAAMAGREHNHPLFEQAKEYIANHPLAYQEERTRRNLYAAALLDEFISAEAALFGKRQKQNLAGVFDDVELNQLRQEISRLAGKLPVERLDLFLRQRFLPVPPLLGFVQALTDELLFALTHRDAETGKTGAALLIAATAQP